MKKIIMIGLIAFTLGSAYCALAAKSKMQDAKGVLQPKCFASLTQANLYSFNVDSDCLSNKCVKVSQSSKRCLYSVFQKDCQGNLYWAIVATKDGSMTTWYKKYKVSGWSNGGWSTDVPYGCRGF